VVKNCNFLLFWWVGVLCITFLCWNYVTLLIRLYNCRCCWCSFPLLNSFDKPMPSSYRSSYFHLQWQMMLKIYMNLQRTHLNDNRPGLVSKFSSNWMLAVRLAIGPGGVRASNCTIVNENCVWFCRNCNGMILWCFMFKLGLLI